MKKKYGEETVEKIEHAELMAALANLTNGEETPDFASLDAVMRSLRAHGAAVDWPESLWPFDVLDYWEVGDARATSRCPCTYAPMANRCKSTF